VPFEDLWIQPAAGDAGGARGIALAIWHRYLAKPRLSPEAAGTWQPARATGNKNGRSRVENNGQEMTLTDGLNAYADGMKGSYLGPRHTENEIEKFLQSRKFPYKKYSRQELPGVVADLLAAGKIIGLHQGRMEFGPRALGGRSIIGDPRSPEMQSVMNLKIKYRESFRPFAPSVLREQVAEWFRGKPERYFLDKERHAESWYAAFARWLLRDEIEEGKKQAIREALGQLGRFWPSFWQNNLFGVTSNIIFAVLLVALVAVITTDFSIIAWAKGIFGSHPAQHP